MGRTYKDQDKYDRKEKGIKEVRKRKHRPYSEVIPEDDPLDRFEEYEYMEGYDDDER